MKVKLVGLLVMVAILLAAAVACTSVEGAQNVQKNTHKNYEVTVEEFMQQNHVSGTIELSKGDTLTLILGSNPTTGFQWLEQAQIANQDILEQTRHDLVAPETKEGNSAPLGAASKEVWVFQSLTSGSTKISQEYSRTWDGGEKGEWTFELNVVVK